MVLLLSHLNIPNDQIYQMLMQKIYFIKEKSKPTTLLKRLLKILFLQVL